MIKLLSLLAEVTTLTSEAETRVVRVAMIRISPNCEPRTHGGAPVAVRFTDRGGWAYFRSLVEPLQHWEEPALPELVGIHAQYAAVGVDIDPRSGVGQPVRGRRWLVVGHKEIAERILVFVVGQRARVAGVNPGVDARL